MVSLLRWMIWGYHYFWKHPYLDVFWLSFGCLAASCSRQTLASAAKVILTRPKLHGLRDSRAECGMPWMLLMMLLMSVVEHVWAVYKTAVCHCFQMNNEKQTLYLIVWNPGWFIGIPIVGGIIPYIIQTKVIITLQIPSCTVTMAFRKVAKIHLRKRLMDINGI